jgi:tRNA threonylcarbamoyladenosine biosynthesis protein TsaE
MSNSNSLMRLHQKESGSPQETHRLAKQWAAEVLEPRMVIALQGDLGAGKTHFVKGAAEGLGIDPHTVNSPTYTLINEYYGDIPVYHFDLYRLEHEDEVWEIGAEEYFYGDGVCFVEWPDRIPGLLPDHTIWIHIEKISGTGRRFLLSNPHGGKDT